MKRRDQKISKCSSALILWLARVPVRNRIWSRWFTGREFVGQGPLVDECAGWTKKAEWVRCPETREGPLESKQEAVRPTAKGRKESRVPGARWSWNSGGDPPGTWEEVTRGELQSRGSHSPSQTHNTDSRREQRRNNRNCVFSSSRSSLPPVRLVSQTRFYQATELMLNRPQELASCGTENWKEGWRIHPDGVKTKIPSTYFLTLRVSFCFPPEAKGQNTFLLPGAGEGRFSSDRVLEGGDQVWLPFFTQGESITLLGTWRTIRKYVSNQRQMSSPHLSAATSAQSPRPVGALLISVEWIMNV